MDVGLGNIFGVYPCCSTNQYFIISVAEYYSRAWIWHVYLSIHQLMDIWVVSFLFFLFFFFFFGCSKALWSSLGQGSDPSHRCDLSLSCVNARSLTRCAGLGIEPAFQCSQDAVYPVVPQQEFLGCFYFSTILNNAAMNICVQVFVWMCVFVFLGLY